MNSYGVYFMIGSIDVVRGGMTRALINRANILSEYYNEIGLITFDFNPDYDPIIQQFKDMGVWNEKIKHFNVFDYLMETHMEASSSDSSAEKDQQSNQLSAIRDQHLLQHIDFFSDSEKFEKREQYDQQGRVRKISYYDLETNNVASDLYLKPNGQCFLKNLYDSVDVKTLSCTWYNHKGEERQIFKKVKDYRDNFINSLVEKNDASVLLSDGRFTDKILFANKNPKVAKVALIHSNHVSSPYQYGSTLNKRNAPLIEKIQNVDAFVTLTERQANDIRKRYGHISTIHTIGHPSVTMKAKSATKIEKEPYTAAIVARFSRIKQIHHAIKAFSKVIKKVPQAKLEIWGFGSQEEKYKLLINRLRLENHVFVMGFTNNASEVYQRAAFTVITSEAEAFAMTIVESMSEGTPVISYDCKYGPSDIIDHEKNGLIIECNNIDALADTMIELFLNQEKLQALSEEARKINNKFGKEIIAQKWMKVFEEAISQKDRRVKLKKITAELTDLQLNNNTMYVEGNVILHDIETSPHIRENLTIGLQLRRRNELEDIYIPIQIQWVDNSSIQFQGEISHFHELTKGQWDLQISCACLNSHKFIPLKTPVNINLDARKKRIAKTVFKLEREKQNLYLYVYKSSAIKQKFDLKNIPRFLYKKYRAKIRDHLEGLG